MTIYHRPIVGKEYGMRFFRRLLLVLVYLTCIAQACVLLMAGITVGQVFRVVVALPAILLFFALQVILFAIPARLTLAEKAVRNAAVTGAFLLGGLILGLVWAFSQSVITSKSTFFILLKRSMPFLTLLVGVLVYGWASERRGLIAAVTRILNTLLAAAALELLVAFVVFIQTPLSLYADGFWNRLQAICDQALALVLFHYGGDFSEGPVRYAVMAIGVGVMVFLYALGPRLLLWYHHCSEQSVSASEAVVSMAPERETR
jgi:hypothetical protein